MNISQEIVRKLIFHLNRKALIFKKCVAKATRNRIWTIKTYGDQSCR